MRTLLLLRGAPGCGKSTWIEKQGFKPYTLSADDVRSLYGTYDFDADGNISISQKSDNAVWKTMFEILENRMDRGEFTVIDACNSKTSEMNRYKDLAHKYRYRIYCVDMTYIPIEQAKYQNKLRPSVKWVPDDYIEKVYSRFETQKIPSGIKAIKPDQIGDIFLKPIDLSKYDKVVHIGDIHGCLDALQNVKIEPNNAYIFLGDYIDRGPDSAGVLKYLLDICELENVCLLEGNHERHLWNWANGEKSRSKEFEWHTKKEIETAGISLTDIRKLYRKMRQCSWYIYRGTKVFCTHGGICGTDAVKRIDYIPAYQMIRGVGAYEEMERCADSFAKHEPDTIQIFGHRNINDLRPIVNANCFCLEGHVEQGGEMRVCILDEDGVGFETYISESAKKAAEERSNVQEAAELTEMPESEQIRELIGKMRWSKLIREMQFGHISSFNFTRTAFYDKKWNDLTTKARGLFIDTLNNKILARGYDKFFAIGERQETQLENLPRILKFPIEVYRKENGFLGMMSFDKATNSVFMSTKSTPEGQMSELFTSMVPIDILNKASEYLQKNDVTLLFEVVNPEHDPHIIEYEKNHLYLLDIVDNSLEFKYMPYWKMCEVAKEIGVETKHWERRLYDWSEFTAFYANCELSGNDRLEGYVFRDANGYMLKYKTDYYNSWKKLRAVADKVYKYEHIQNTGILSTPIENYFYKFVKDYYAEHKADPDRHRVDIITLRKLFYEQMSKKEENDENS